MEEGTLKGRPSVVAEQRACVLERALELAGVVRELAQRGVPGLLLLPRGASEVVARLERYDRLVLETDPIALGAVEAERRIALELVDGFVSAWIDGAPVFERVPVAPIAGRDRIGIATWGPEPRIRSLELFERR